MYFLPVFNGFVLWVMTSRGLTNGSQRFEGTDCLHFRYCCDVIVPGMV